MAKIFTDKPTKYGWREIKLKEPVTIPDSVLNKEEYIEYLKICDYIDSIQTTYTHIKEDGTEVIVSTMGSSYILAKTCEFHGIPKEIEDQINERGLVMKSLNMQRSVRKKKFTPLLGKTSTILDSRRSELIEMFGKLYTIQEVHQHVRKQMGYDIGVSTIRKFYSANLSEIEALRADYESNFSDLSLTKKRGRLDKLSHLFYTFFNKFKEKKSLAVSRELRAI